MKKNIIWAIVCIFLAIALGLSVTVTVIMFNSFNGLVEDYKAIMASQRETIKTQDDLLNHGFPGCAYLMLTDNGDGLYETQPFMLANSYSGDTDLRDCAEFSFNYGITESCTGIRLDFVNAANIELFTINNQTYSINEAGQVFIPVDDIVALTGHTENSQDDATFYDLELKVMVNDPGSPIDIYTYEGTLVVYLTN